jgi:hypothetical protein
MEYGVAFAGLEPDKTSLLRPSLYRETLMFREMEELCYPPIAEAKAVPTGTVMLRLALALQPAEPARTEVRLVEVGPDKRNGALETRGFAIRHRLRRVLR